MIKGVNLGDKEVKNTLFADDATFMTDGSRKSFETLIDVLDNFSFISGLKLNEQKCNVLRIGSLKNKNIKYSEKKKLRLEYKTSQSIRNGFPLA